MSYVPQCLVCGATGYSACTCGTPPRNHYPHMPVPPTNPLPPKKKPSLRIVIFPEGDGWVAQCLEYDILTAATTIAEVIERMVDLMKVEIAMMIETGKVLDKGPRKFQAMWELST